MLRRAQRNPAGGGRLPGSPAFWPRPCAVREPLLTAHHGRVPPFGIATRPPFWHPRSLITQPGAAMWQKNFKIVSGGQTGADRAALDWARRRGVPHGGWCPAGRLAEDGAIDAAYQLAETPAGTYLQRTEWNVRDSCGTVIFSLSETLSGGSLATQKFAEAHGKPCLHLSSGAGEEVMAGRLVAFLRQHRILVLNVAGPSAAKEPGLGRVVLATLDRAYRLGQAEPE